MRKTIVFLSFLAFLSACNNSKESAPAATTDTEKKSADEDPVAQKGLELIAKSTCLGCHKIEEKFTGPAYRLVAERYPKNDAVIDSLSNKVMKGGSGNWGTIPMPANPVTKEDATAMVTYILSLKK